MLTRQRSNKLSLPGKLFPFSLQQIGSFFICISDLWVLGVLTPWLTSQATPSGVILILFNYSLIKWSLEMLSSLHLIFVPLNSAGTKWLKREHLKLFCQDSPAACCKLNVHEWSSFLCISSIYKKTKHWKQEALRVNMSTCTIKHIQCHQIRFCRIVLSWYVRNCVSLKCSCSVVKSSWQFV